MPRNNRVRLSDDELELVDDAAEERWGEEVAEEVPRGKTIAQLAKEFLTEEGQANV